MNINPGIRKVVELLNKHGFTTTDSGDGKTHDHDCDREYGYVVIKVSNVDNLAVDADNVKYILERHGVVFGPLTGNSDQRAYIQANYSPVDKLAFIDVSYITDDDLDS